MPEELGDWLRGKETSLTSIAAAARAAIHRVQNDSSELRELWQDSDEFLAWHAGLDAIVAALGS